MTEPNNTENLAADAADIAAAQAATEELKKKPLFLLPPSWISRFRLLVAASAPSFVFA